MWSFGVLLTNSYIVYTRVMKQEGVEKPLTHYQYLLAIAKDWINSEEKDIKQLLRRKARKRKYDAAC